LENRRFAYGEHLVVSALKDK